MCHQELQAALNSWLGHTNNYKNSPYSQLAQDDLRPASFFLQKQTFGLK